MIETAGATANRPDLVETVAYVDADDRHYAHLGDASTFMGVAVRIIRGERRTMSDLWNPCAADARGDIIGVAADDIRFRTVGWDSIVRDAVAEWPDRIVLVHGTDGSPWGDRMGTHPFVTRRWVETVGRFTPEMFEMDYVDRWLHDVAVMLDRRVVVPVVMEHLHPHWGTAPMDQTHRDKYRRGEQQQPDTVYCDTAGARSRDAALLAEAMEAPGGVLHR